MKTGKKWALACGLLAALCLTEPVQAQQGRAVRPTNRVGKMSLAEFDQVNKQGAAAVAAVNAGSQPLSEADRKLMMDVAAGGMMQLEMSRIAAEKANSESVRKLAQAEVEEQTGLSDKLKEIAAAKNITLPVAPDAQTQEMVAKMQSMSGMELDRFYVQESGVKGHEKLNQVMARVKSTATDPALKGVAEAAHPLVRTHLRVAQDMAQMRNQNGMNGQR